MTHSLTASGARYCSLLIRNTFCAIAFSLALTSFAQPSTAQSNAAAMPTSLVQQAAEQNISTNYMNGLSYPSDPYYSPSSISEDQIYKQLYSDGTEADAGPFQPVINWMDNNLNPFKVMARNNDQLVAQSNDMQMKSLDFVHQTLISMLKLFIYNPNVAIDTPGDETAFGQAVAGMSSYIRKLAEIVYAIALDLSLLFFILSIWRHWANAAVRGR